MLWNARIGEDEDANEFGQNDLVKNFTEERMSGYKIGNA